MSDLSFEISLLPHRPSHFFRLEATFDLKDLKRAYGKAIRQFRPETHSAEFQLVRAAYEELERDLRYGRSHDIEYLPMNLGEGRQSAPYYQHSSNADEQQASSQQKKETRNPSQSEKSSPAELDVLQLASIDPIAAFKKLESKNPWTAKDYLTAAMLSDLNSSSDPHAFLSWLLEGLAKYPKDLVLYRLVVEYIAQDVSDEELGVVANLIAKKLRSFLFYILTEPLWKRNFRKFPATKVATELSDCESYILQCPYHVSVAFDIELLPIAAWSADPEWVETRLAMINAGSLEFPSYLIDAYLEMTNFLEYVASERNQKSLSGVGPVLQEARNAIRNWGRPESGNRYQQSTAFFLRMLNSQKKLLEQNELNLYFDEKSSTFNPILFLGACSYVSERLAIETGFPIRNPGAPQIERVVADLLNVLNRTVPRIYSKKEVPRMIFQVLPFGFFLLLSIMLILFQVFVFSSWNSPFGLAGAFLIVVSYMTFQFLISSRFKPAIQRYQARVLSKAYKKYWRERLFLFFRNNGIGVEEFLVATESFRHRYGQTTAVELLHETIPYDSALQIFACSQRFRV